MTSALEDSRKKNNDAKIGGIHSGLLSGQHRPQAGCIGLEEEEKGQKKEERKKGDKHEEHRAQLFICDVTITCHLLHHLAPVLRQALGALAELLLEIGGLALKGGGAPVGGR